MRALTTFSGHAFCRGLSVWTLFSVMILACFFAPTQVRADGEHEDETQDTQRDAKSEQEFLRRREALLKDYTETDWDYPFVLKGFDEDILHCSSIVPKFEGNKLCLTCESGLTQVRQAANEKAIQPGPAPAFDPVTFLNKRYGYRAGFKGPLHAPLEERILQQDFKGNVSWEYDTSESFQHAVPTFCQPYYHDKRWHLLLVVAMYKRQYKTSLLDQCPEFKGDYKGLDPIRYVAFSFEYKNKSWKLLQEKNTYATLSRLKRERRREYAFSPSYAPGQGVLRLWKMPNGQFALLDMQFKSEPSLGARTKLVMNVYVLDKRGTLLKPAQVEAAHMNYRELDSQTWRAYSILKALKLRSGVEFVQTEWSETQTPGKPDWVSEPGTAKVRVEHEKLKGRFRILWLF